MVGGEVFGTGHDSVDLIGQLLRFLLQLLVLLQQLPAGAQVMTFGGVLKHPLDSLDLHLSILHRREYTVNHLSLFQNPKSGVGSQMAERFGNRATNQKVAGLIPSSDKNDIVSLGNAFYPTCLRG